MKLNKKTAAVISVITGSVILATAAFANYTSSNGYDVYKNAIKKLLKEKNYTMELSGGISLDGNLIQPFETLYEEIDLNTNSMYRRTSEQKSNASFICISESSTKDGTTITKDNFEYTDDGNVIETNGNAFVNDTMKSSRIYGTFTLSGNDETIDKQVRFLELASDLVVGDLKNNFIYVGEKDDCHEYSISLDKFQIPEIINAGLSLITGTNYDQERIDRMSEESLNKDPLCKIYKDTEVKSGSCRVTLDDLGRIAENTIEIQIIGKDSKDTEHVLTFTANLKINKYGETTPEQIDISKCGVVKYSSTQRQNRIKELKKLIESAQTEEDKKNYQSELDYLEDLISNKDSDGPTTEATYVND